MKTYRILAALAVSALLANTAIAQGPAPFAGGVKLQQGGATNPANGLTFSAKNATPYSGNVILNFVQPASNGIFKVSSFGAGAGDVTITSLDLSTDVGASILPIANGGTGASTALGAINNLLPTQTGNANKFLTTDGTNPSWASAVTSVGLSLPAELTVTNSPVTTSGTLTATWASEAAGTVFAAPAGSSGTPTFRALVASDIPNLDASKITTGTLPVSRGGTGASSFTGNAVVTTNAGGTALTTQSLTDGQLLIGSSGAAPTAATLTAGTGISITNGPGSISIATSSNGTNKATVNLSATSISYTGNAPPSGFTLTATSTIAITVFEKGGFPITATVTNINTTNNTYDFVISGYPTAASTALVIFQN